MIGPFLITGVLFVFLIAIQGIGAREMPDSAAQQEMMARAMELAQPGDEHRLLEQLTGEWNHKTNMWMTADAEPLAFPGTASAKMVLDGRFLSGKFTTEAEEMSGAGLYIMGYDRRHEKFTYVGFDTWGTYSLSASSTYDEATNSITMYGEDADPILSHTQKYDFVVQFESEDT